MGVRVKPSQQMLGHDPMAWVGVECVRCWRGESKSPGCGHRGEFDVAAFLSCSPHGGIKKREISTGSALYLIAHFFVSSARTSTGLQGLPWPPALYRTTTLSTLGSA